jgi:O-antigen/teichoic acid export membrane protein
MSLAKNTFYYVLGSVLSMLASFLLAPLYTRYLGTSVYGEYALIQTLITLCQATFTLQLHTSVGRYYIDLKNSPEELKNYISSIFWSLIFISLTFIIIAMALHEVVIVRVFQKIQQPLFPIYALAYFDMLMRILALVPALLLKFQKRGRQFFKIQVLSSFTLIILALYFIVQRKFGIQGIFLALSFSSLFSAVFLIKELKPYLKLYFGFSEIRSGLHYSLPMIPHALSGFIFRVSDKIIMAWFFPLSIVGIYSLADKITQVIKVIINSYNSAYLPVGYELIKANKNFHHKINQHMLIFTSLGSLMILGFSLFSQEIIWLFFSEEFSDAWKFIPVLSLSYLFRIYWNHFTLRLFYEKKTKFIPIITIMAGSVNIMGNLIFFNIYGPMVAAYTTLISYLMTAALGFYFARKYAPLHFQINKVIFLSLFMTIVCQIISSLTIPIQIESIFLKLLSFIIFSLIIFKIIGLKIQDTKKVLTNLVKRPTN